ncbi:SulP family inorganic anion transporter [Gordonia humi]|uniref:MFS superfamily sulfate permease-like transporter n=1 Tax=Gordonia humi TaxID=686429 RepID=A0A840EU66_9ACTN|nr:MFS superfamily sulfate permease-like transporter [Gordonia humi]
MIAHPESVKTIGHVDTGLPQVRFPAMSDVWSVAPQILTVSFGCVLVILAQSAATARSFAQSHGDHVDVNRDILGLAGSNVAAAFTGTFVVNSSPTKTAVLDQQKGRSQLANVTMAVTTLLVVAFATPLLEHLPEAVLAGIVFVVGVELVHARAFVSIWRIRPIECAVAVSTTLMVVFFGVLTGIVAAMVLSLLQMIHRQYRPKRFVIGLDDDGRRAYEKASPGRQTMPGLIVFRYDADLFYANVGRFADDVTALVKGAPDPVKWLVLDVSATSDVDYSAARSMHSLIGFVHSIGAHFVLAGVTPELKKSLETAKIIADISPDSFYPGVGSAIKAFTKAHPAS